MGTMECVSHVPKLERHPTGTTFQTFGGRNHLDQFYYVHRCWNRLLGLESREVGGGRRGKKTLAHEFSVQMRSMDNAKTGSGLGLAVLVALAGAMLEPQHAGEINSGRFPQPRWFDRDATERVSNPSPLPLKTAPLA